MTDIVLLHGALGAADQLSPLAERLTGHGRVHVVELEGHGTTPGSGQPFAMARFVDQVVEAMDARGVERATLFGYSMGGYVALLLAAARPERTARVVTLGTKFRWDPETAAREARRLDPAAIRAKVPRFADALAALLVALGDAPALTDETLGAVRCPARVMVGDRDATVTVEETAGAYRMLGDGELAVLPRTPHPLEQVDVGLLARLVTDPTA